MKPRLIFWTVGLVAAIGLSSCAPAVTSPPAALTDAPAPATAAPVDSPLPQKQQRLCPLPHNLWKFKPSPPPADPTSKPPTLPPSIWLRVNYNWWNFSASPEVPAAQWRPWFMGLKRSILAKSSSHILMQTIPILMHFNAISVFITSPSYIYWMRMEMC